jgi:hypothetical protein
MDNTCKYYEKVLCVAKHLLASPVSVANADAEEEKQKPMRLECSHPEVGAAQVDCAVNGLEQALTKTSGYLGLDQALRIAHQ